MRVGVTGGIGSGKTSVCRVFELLGIPVFNADEIARNITDGDYLVQSALSEISGTDLFLSGELDRKLLASLIFNDTDKLQKVNALIHPLVFARFESWSADQGTPYVIMEAAILFESGADRLVDKTIAVIAPYEERIGRVISRSGLSFKEVEERIKNQLPQEELTARADFIINNCESDMVIPAVLEIHSLFLSYTTNTMNG